LLLSAYSGCIIASTRFGLGNHITQISPEDLIEAVKLMYIGNFFVILAIAVSKTSFALTLLGLAIEKWQYWLLWFVILSVNLIMGADSLFQWTSCTPLEKTWNSTIPGTCLDINIVVSYSIFAGGMTI
jgi:hypothetical protein